MSGPKTRDSRAMLAPADAVIEAARLRADAETRYGEVDLLVAALREHIDDLRLERDRLLRDVARMRDDLRRERATWLDRGMKPSR